MSDKAIYQGVHIKCYANDHIARMVLDHQGASVNKFDASLLQDLGKAIAAIEKESGLKGLVIQSAKDVFVVGADITEFLGRFAAEDAQLKSWLEEVHAMFSKIEDLPYPTVTAINGICLGGGMELALSTSFRIASDKASLGLPETKLGIYPGWGGTIRLPRLIGADNAIEWIASGGTYKPMDALQYGAVDAVVPLALLEKSAIKLCQDAWEGKLDWKKRQQEKTSPLNLVTPIESMMVFEGAKAFVAGQAGPFYPAPVSAVKAMAKHATMKRQDAMHVEIDGFIKLAKSEVAHSLVTVFLADQFVKKKSKSQSAASAKIKHAGVLGAGIMGGGIAYQSASKGTPILMKDIRPEALELGLTEASKLFGKLVASKKIDAAMMARGISAITPCLSYGDFKLCDVVVEAVVENENVKKKVLAEVEGEVRPDCIIASNTSTISITQLAKALKRPENFCGMHFFNPVHRMPLVEVIRGEKTSEASVAAVVAYALALGKTPIVVNDCPGFLVNRVLFPYIFGFVQLLTDGVAFERIDKVMEKFGWPMGPAYLLDVIGIDTCVHAADVMAKGFPDRMIFAGDNAISLLKGAGRLGQKSGSGFYAYSQDAKGKPIKKADPAVAPILAKVKKASVEVSDEEIIQRLMIPMINETARCLEEKIVASPAEADIALLYGLGFPPFRGGVFKYLDSLGSDNFCALTKKYASLGKAYEAAPLVLAKAKSKEPFYSAMGV